MTARRRLTLFLIGCVLGVASSLALIAIDSVTRGRSVVSTVIDDCALVRTRDGAQLCR